MGSVENFWADADIISSYSRAQALEDGALVALPEAICKEAGFKFPVACTCGVWALLAPDVKARLRGESLEGRLWDTLYMFGLKARARGGDRVRFQLYYTVNGRKQLTTLVGCIGPGDTAEPVITILAEDED